ncbi:MAG: porphobilinogen synthase, partial [Lentisphaeria bacterium]|nr:porphobilinogen synthase [Lentisphaeria bacterium]
MSFPSTRMRRLRQLPALRDLSAETTLTMDHLMMPLFVRHGQGIRHPIASMPGNQQMSVDALTEECVRLAGLGVRS